MMADEGQGQSHVEESDGEENERRWIVLDFDRDVLRYPNVYIEQGYFGVLSSDSFRVRIADRAKAAQTHKIGTKGRRRERQKRVELDTARFMYESTPYKLQKRRRVIDGWHLDVFEGLLTGIVLVEFEAGPDGVFPELPPWITRAVEVTDSLTNLDLARLAYELGEEAASAVFRTRLAPTLPHVVFTGPPCSGKSELLRELTKRHSGRVHCVPETATVLIGQVGILPSDTDPLRMARFQRTVYDAQMAFEEGAEINARIEGRSCMVMDRGTVDGRAYVPSDEAFARATRSTIEAERARYAKVLCLAAPPRAVFDAKRGNNASRSETSYERILELDGRIREAWGPGATVIDGATWEEKRDRALAALAPYLQ